MPEPSAYNDEIKKYLESLCSPEDDVLSFVRAHAYQLGMPDIHIPAHVGKWLYLLAKIQGASRILEIGTLAGYSTIWLARSLPSNGHLISIEYNRKHIEIAKLHIEEAGLSHCVTIEEGQASDLLKQWITSSIDPFDFIFIDADKAQNDCYLDCSIRLAKPGSLIIVDNLLPKGELIGRPCNGEAIAVYQFNQYFAQHPQLESIMMPTIVGKQGRIDSLGIARVKSATF